MEHQRRIRTTQTFSNFQMFKLNQLDETFFEQFGFGDYEQGNRDEIVGNEMEQNHSSAV